MPSFINVGTIIAAAIVFILILIIMSGYVKAPTDKAYIISGLKKNPKVLIGRAGIKIPFFERKDELMLKQISIDIKTDGFIPTQDFIGVDIDAVAKIRMLTEKDITVGPDGELMQGIKPTESKRITREMVDAAMKNFLNMKEDQIRNALTDSLQGNMREIIGTQPLKNLCNDRKSFGDEVQAKAQKDLNALGVWIESCNIQKIKDEKGLITALGQDNMSKIQKDASIAKAQADMEVAIAEADARKAANDAQVASQTDIAMKQNELKIKQAELKKAADLKQAEADAAYKIQEQEQRKTIEITTANADIASREKEIELKQKEAEVKEQELAATVRKQAEADKYQVEKRSEADLFRRQKEAEAKKYEEMQAAEAAKIKAEASLYARQQEAAGIAAVGKAEAEAIQAKGVAEAEALDKKAEAMKKYGQAAILEMIVQKLPEMAAEIARPLSTIDKVTIIDSGNGSNGVSSMGEYVPSVLARTIESVKEVTGVDVAEIMKANTYDAKVNRHLTVDGIDAPNVEVSVGKENTSDVSEDTY